jgi:hypothetical protein
MESGRVESANWRVEVGGWDANNREQITESR